MNRSDLERARASAPTNELTLEGLVQRRARKERHRRTGALIVAAAIGVVAIAGTLAVYDGTMPSARTTAGSTESGSWTMPPGLAIPDGSYAYVRSVVYGDTEAYELQSWFSPGDGSGRIREAGSTSDQPDDSEIAGQQEPYVLDQEFAPGEMTSGQDPNMDPLDGLSTDPAVLTGQLVARSTPSGASPIPAPTSGPDQAASPGRMSIVIHGLMGRANATPQLKAALSQVLAGLDGATVNTATTDPLGRPAWSVSLERPADADDRAQANTWWFDPHTDQLLVHESRTGPFTFFTVYEASGVVPDTRTVDTSPSFIPATTAAPRGDVESGSDS